MRDLKSGPNLIGLIAPDKSDPGSRGINFCDINEPDQHVGCHTRDIQARWQGFSYHISYPMLVLVVVRGKGPAAYLSTDLSQLVWREISSLGRGRCWHFRRPCRHQRSGQSAGF